MTEPKTSEKVAAATELDESASSTSGAEVIAPPSPPTEPEVLEAPSGTASSSPTSQTSPIPTSEAATEAPPAEPEAPAVAIVWAQPEEIVHAEPVTPPLLLELQAGPGLVMASVGRLAGRKSMTRLPIRTAPMRGTESKTAHEPFKHNCRLAGLVQLDPGCALVEMRFGTNHVRFEPGCTPEQIVTAIETFSPAPAGQRVILYVWNTAEDLAAPAKAFRYEAILVDEGIAIEPGVRGTKVHALPNAPVRGKPVGRPINDRPAPGRPLVPTVGRAAFRTPAKPALPFVPAKPGSPDPKPDDPVRTLLGPRESEELAKLLETGRVLPQGQKPQWIHRLTGARTFESGSGAVLRRDHRDAVLMLFQKGVGIAPSERLAIARRLRGEQVVAPESPPPNADGEPAAPAESVEAAT